MQCTYTGSYNENHGDNKRRRLIGSEKDRAIKEMIDYHTSPSVYYRNEANRLMIDGKFLYLCTE